MSKMNEHNKFVPALRFSEFDENWEIKNLGSIAENLSNKRIPITSSKREKGEIPYYGATGIIDYVKDFIFDEELLLISEDGANLIDRNYPIAFSISGKTWVNNHAHVLRFKNKSTEALVQKFINSRSIEDYLTGQAQPKLNRKNLERISIPLAKAPKEQQKIAATLTSLDNLITAENEKLEALQAHKKGLLQQLFPAKGEKVPKLRFGEFSGEWDFRRIERNIDLLSGVALKSSELTSDKTGVPILRGINITEGKIRHSTEMDKFYLGDISQLDKYLVEENDIVIGMDGSKVGKNVSLISKHDIGSILIQRVARIRSVDSNFEFLYQHFVSNGFRRYVDMVNTSSGIPHISSKQVRDYEIGFPPTIKEQEKIATCLSSLDDTTVTQSEKIDALKEHKKGLMQQMFPKI